MFAVVLHLALTLLPAPAASLSFDDDANQAKRDAALSWRSAALSAAESKLQRLSEQVLSGDDVSTYDADAVAAVKSWLLQPAPTGPGDLAYKATVDAALGNVRKNRAASRNLVVTPDPEADAYCAAQTPSNAYAWHDSTKRAIFLCPAWASSSDACRNSVVTHEYFHAAGLRDIPSPTSTTSALSSADWMTGLACELYFGAANREQCGHPC